MPISFIRALTILHGTFRRHSVPQRLHVLGRFLSAPFLRIVDAVPPKARVLDIGGGHGLYARLLAENGAATVVALDPDLRKVLPSFRHPAVRFVAGFADAVRGEFDAVTIIDVVYRLDDAGRDALFANCRELLKADGVLVVKDLDPDAPLKSRWNRLQERFFADRLNLTVGTFAENDTRQQMEARLLRAGLIDVHARRIDSGYPHAHIVYTARKPR